MAPGHPMQRRRLAWSVPCMLVLVAVLPLACQRTNNEGADPKGAAREKQAPPAKPREKQIEVSLGGDVKMKLALIEAGKFRMGSPPTEKKRHADEGPQHEVEITRAFYLGVYQVTQAEYEKLMGKNPSYYSPTGGGKKHVDGMNTARFPVETVSWADVMEFCRRLSQKEGESFDLPTEAEWEYACRAGTTGPFAFGDDISSKQANFESSWGYLVDGPLLGLARTTQVGSYAPNAFGLYDMHGNVWQFCKDWYQEDYYRESPRRDPPGPAQGTLHVIRGGSHGNSGGDARSAFRHKTSGQSGDQALGFRVVMRIP